MKWIVLGKLPPPSSSICRELFCMVDFCMKYLFIILMTLLLFSCGESSDTANDSDGSNETNTEY